MNWQPIDTAPKDGTAILCYLPKAIDRHYPADRVADNFAICFWEHQRWCAVDVEDCGSMGGELTGWMSDWCCLEVKPSHWMPLPEAPE